MRQSLLENRGKRLALNTLYVVLGFPLWFLVTRGWDEYSTLISPICAVAMGLVQIYFWVKVFGKRNPMHEGETATATGGTAGPPAGNARLGREA